VIVNSKNGNILLQEVDITTNMSYIDIDSILISSDDNSNFPIEIDFYLTKSAKYYNTSKTILSKFSTFFMRLLHKNSLNVKINTTEINAKLLLRELEENLSGSNKIDDIENIRYWKEVSGNFKIPRVKLVYSKNNLSLKQVLAKYNKLKT
jgi:hypothetical protein